MAISTKDRLFLHFACGALDQAADRARRLYNVDISYFTVLDITDKVIAFKGRCAYCQNKLKWDNLTLDHIIPLSRGGEHSLRNIVVCCQSCNSSKGAKPAIAWLECNYQDIPEWLIELSRLEWFILASYEAKIGYPKK